MAAHERTTRIQQQAGALARVLRLFGGAPRAANLAEHYAIYGAAAELIEFVPAPAAAATDAPPGSTAKIEVLRARLERGEELFHPDDADDWGSTCGAAGHGDRQRACLRCGTPLLKVPARSRFCSQACYQRWRREARRRNLP